jgi:anti-sigma factor RsiW
MTPDLDCIELVEMTTDYFEGALAPDDVARLEAHLTECDGCTEYVRQMRVTQAALGQVDVATIAAPARERLLAAFRAWKSERLDA